MMTAHVEVERSIRSVVENNIGGLNVKYTRV